ncbi:hypothetical protein C4D60_Mb01t18590 [Musa balbisiana]|uniref:Protein kinase domain-containing protein n=1 Tax=Musa balbisiana TaxID=52838 RepID=A0A4S8JNE7_MUSBA|nr:hypothetical protein C4D60_Mb01t18590 [Musa balbisiana]
MPPSGTSFFLSISRCETLILEEQANGFQWSKRGFPSHGVGTLLLSPTSSCAPHHGNIDQALDPLLPRWFAVFRHRCFSCCFCDSPIWSAAGPIRLMKTLRSWIDRYNGLPTVKLDFSNLFYSDLSKNNLQGDVPYQLPPNVIHINLAGNALTGGVPYSISQMTDLNYLNLANNQLSGQLTDVFGKLHSLSLLDLSFNHFSGNLPQSFGSLSSLRTLNIQNNQFSGSLGVLAPLSLEDLNVQNNHLTGWIPNKLRSIDNLKVDGNSWSSGPAPPGMSKAADRTSGSSSTNKHSGLKAAAIAVIVIAVLVVILIMMALLKRRSSASSCYIDEQHSQNRSFTPLVDDEFAGSFFHVVNCPESLWLKDSSSLVDMKAFENPSLDLNSPLADTQKSLSDNEFAKRSNSRRSTDRISPTIYSLADLQAATLSFSASRLLGQGNIGRTYKAKSADGKVLAVKKIEALSLSGRSSYNFKELVSGISKLHHPNIAELLGYCSEPGYQLLVYELQRNGSLHGFLHLSDDYSKPLTWETRVRIALGTACALEYLHEVCSPSAIHKNIKSANILLDAELNPRLADCGLTVFFEVSTKFISIFSKPRLEQSLVRWAAPQLHDIDALARMVDPALRGLYPPKSLSRFADVVALCIQSEPEFRPATSEVVQALVRCVQRPSFNMRMGGDMSTSRRSDDSDYGYN